MSDLAVIIPAAGSSSRFGGADKLLAPLRGDQPVIARTLQIFLEHPRVGLVVLATRDGVPPGDHRVKACRGGASRAESVRNALATVPRDFEWVAVHDAARPLVSARLIDDVLAAAMRYGAAILAVPVVPTIKQADGPLPAKVQRTVPRKSLWAVQTPQVMRRRVLEDAYATCTVPLEQVTDEAQLLELAGQDVWLVPGEERNLKITTPDDLRLARALLGEDARR